MFSGITTDLTKTFGPNHGEEFDDAIAVGGADKIEYLKEIRFYQGALFDSIMGVYSMHEGEDKETKHGDKVYNQSVTLNEHELLMCVSGMIGGVEAFKGKKYLNSISFSILDTRNSNVRVAGPYGPQIDIKDKHASPEVHISHGTPFCVCGPIIAFKGKTATEAIAKGCIASVLTLGFVPKPDVKV